MPWLQQDFVDDFVSDLKTATIDSVDDLVDNFVDDFVNKTAIDRKTKNEFANDFVSDLKTATIDSVDDLVDNFVDDFVNETAMDRKTKNEFANNFVNTKVNNSTQQTILLISHFWHFKALKHWFDWLKKILTYSQTPRLALGWTITSFCIFISTFVRAQKSRVLSPRTRNLLLNFEMN